MSTIDAACDLAALCYGSEDRPDDVMTAFASRLRQRNVEVVGVVQTPGNAPRTRLRRGFGLALLPELRALESDIPDDGDAAKFAIRQDLLRQAEAALLAGLKRRPGLLLINRFGSSELAGGGLLGVVLQALALRIPVLVAVPEGLHLEWLAWCRGRAVDLDCSAGDLERWWRSLVDSNRMRHGYSLTE